MSIPSEGSIRQVKLHIYAQLCNKHSSLNFRLAMWHKWHSYIGYPDTIKWERRGMPANKTSEREEICCQADIQNAH